MRVARALSLSLALGFGLWCEDVQAFSAADQFAAPVAQGGGAGRYFTGSYVDGYACSVCHSGGTPPAFRVTGLPNGYMPGATYEIEVSWDKPNVHHALNFELIGKDGNLPGQVALLDPTLVDARGRCTGLINGKIPAFERTAGTRKVLGIEPCEGVSSVRFRFTPANVPELAFSLSGITSNRLGNVEGDGVTTIRKVLRRAGEPAQTGDCSLVQGAPRASSSGLMLALLACFAGLFARRSRAR